MIVSIDNKGVYVQLAMTPEAKVVDILHAGCEGFFRQIYFSLRNEI